MNRRDQRLTRSRRIRKRSEFLNLQRRGQRRSSASFLIISQVRSGGDSRLGITASRRVGGAVARNRVKRLVREFFRLHREEIQPPRDIVVIARSAAANLGYAELERELAGALKIDAALGPP